jgi:hypothetical protein
MRAELELTRETFRLLNTPNLKYMMCYGNYVNNNTWEVKNTSTIDQLVANHMHAVPFQFLLFMLLFQRFEISINECDV